MQVEMIDRFGLLPDATRRLFDITALKLRATPLGIRKLEASDQGGRIIFYPNPPIDGTTIIDLLQRKGSNYSVDGEEKLRFRMSLPTFLDRMNFLHDLLTTLSIPEQRGKGAA